MVTGVDAANPGHTLIGEDGDQRMHAVVGLNFVTPSTFGRCAAQPNGADLTYFHRYPLLIMSACS
jgi:hypothetical protein